VAKAASEGEESKEQPASPELEAKQKQ